MLGFLLLFAAGPVSGQYKYPFENPDLPLEDRVNNIVSLMTLDEKVALLSQRPGVPRLGIRTMQQVEGLHGLRAGRSPTTTYPQAIGLGETWDTDILHQVGATEGYEARYVFQSTKYRGGALVIRAPNADMGRDIRWGRTEECYGEDPFLTGTLTVAFIKGMQGDDPKYWQSAALLKHFLANSNEKDRAGSSSDFDERLFYEYYSVPFRMCFVEGGARCFMAAYNAWNKIPMTAHPVIQDVVVKDWGVDGVICTDAGSLGNMVKAHRYYADLPHGAAGAIKAGMNQFLDKFEGPTRDALKQKLLTEADLDKVIKGTFRVWIRLGLIDTPDRNPYAKIGTETTDPWTTQKARDSVRLATQKSIVLLKNTGNLLPLDKTVLKSVAVIGPRANEVIRDWYGGTAPYIVTPLAGIKDKLGAAANVQYASGQDVPAAVALAKSSDVAIVCVGNNPNLNNSWMKVSDTAEGREAIDRQSIVLGSGQEELIKQIFTANPRTVVVLVSSFPYAINWTQEHIPAILHLAHSSQEQGNALADVLFGDYNPAGRLVQTWPRSLDQLPPMMDYNIRHGQTYMYFKGQPLYPFGYGLSYTTFSYSNLKTSADSLSKDGAITVSIDVQNSGKVAGEEVVQLYVKHLGSAVPRPAQELRGFKRVALRPGERKTVELPLQAKALAYWNVDRHSFVVEPGKIELLAGRSSADILLKKTITVNEGIPHLEKRGPVTQLIVDDKPFLALAGELHNSSSSSMAYMKPIWPRLAQMNLNTVLAALSWELTEPEEGKFDFTLVDALIRDARRYAMRLVFLWFGSWKNGESSYVPYWVKTDSKRFPLVQDASGRPRNILSTFGEASRNADARAFAALMRHIREVDGQQHTVIAVQVENECGVLGDSRDRCAAANESFGERVPRQLTDYLQKHKNTLIPEFRKVWEAAGAKPAGTWQEVFGKGIETDVIFMAWNYAQYVGRVAAAGKAEYPLPMFVNAWLVQSANQKPGAYPSGGPVAQVHDLWRAGAPQIDFLSPDIYLTNFEEICALYSRAGNPFFIPEARGGALGATNALTAILKYNAMGFAPFGIDGRGGGPSATKSGGDPLGQTYAVLSYLAPVILENQGKGTIVVLPPTGGSGGAPAQVQQKLGNYTLEISYASQPPAAPQNLFPGAIVIATGPDEFVFVGAGLNVKFTPATPGPSNVSLASFDESIYVDGRWAPGRRLNGDESNNNKRWPSMAAFGIYRIKLYRNQ